MSALRIRRDALLVSAALMLAAASAEGGALFESAFMSSAVPHPRTLVAGDLDGDGHPDLVITPWSTDVLTVMLGNGDGTFTPGSDLVLASPYAPALGDLDGDGDLDLAVTSNATATVTVLLNSGDATFSSPVALATGDGPRGVAIADVSGDGRPDLVVGNAGTISILIQRPNGTFMPKQDYVTDPFPIGGTNSVAIGDLNADGWLDVAASHDQSNNVSILLGTGGGVLGAKTDYSAGAHQEAVMFGDVNGDLKLDMVTANVNGSGYASIWLGNGNGTFGSRSDILTGGQHGSKGGALADFNGDGKLDIAVAMYDAVFFVLALGNGDGTFGAGTDHGTGIGPQGIVAVDFDGDGHLDIGTADDVSETVSIHLGDGSGVFGSSQDLPLGAALQDVAVGNLNADVWPDIAVAEAPGPPPSRVIVDLASPGGLFGSGTGYVTGEVPRAVAIDDFDGDGAADVVTANHACCGVNVSLLKGNGNGTFQPRVDFATWPRPSALALGDVNGDGRRDIAVVNDSTTRVSILIGNGDGTFQSHADYVVNLSRSFDASIRLADLNGDSRADVVVPDPLGSVKVLLANANGSLGTAVGYAAATGPTDIAVGDWDEDGKPDLAVSCANRVVSILLGNGDGTFGSATNLTAGRGGGHIASADLDGDGHLDLALASSVFVWVLLGDGAGGFSSTLGYGTGEPAGVRRIAIADMNRDGRPDVVSMGPTRVSSPSPGSIGVALLRNALPPLLGAPVGPDRSDRLSVSVYPNPAALQATIRFRLSTATRARVEIYDLAGRRVGLVTDRGFSPGMATVIWDGHSGDGRSVRPGLYRARIRTAEASEAATFVWLAGR